MRSTWVCPPLLVSPKPKYLNFSRKRYGRSLKYGRRELFLVREERFSLRPLSKLSLHILWSSLTILLLPYHHTLFHNAAPSTFLPHISSSWATLPPYLFVDDLQSSQETIQRNKLSHANQWWYGIVNCPPGLTIGQNEWQQNK